MFKVAEIGETPLYFVYINDILVNFIDFSMFTQKNVYRKYDKFLETV